MIIFKDRREAGEKLADLLFQKIKGKKNIVVVSLLRGGVIVGDEVAKKFKAPHFGLPVVKISAPDNEELAIGALVFKTKFYNPQLISWYGKELFWQSEEKAIKKLDNYCQIFNIQEKDFHQLKNKAVILVDDGAATGSSLKAASLFLKERKVKKIILALPVAPTDFETKFYDEAYILHQDPNLSAVSQFYQDFSQVNEEEVKKILKKIFLFDCLFFFL